MKEFAPGARAARSQRGGVRREATRTTRRHRRNPEVWAEKTEFIEIRERVAETQNKQDPACHACDKSPQEWGEDYCQACGRGGSQASAGEQPPGPPEP